MRFGILFSERKNMIEKKSGNEYRPIFFSLHRTPNGKEYENLPSRRVGELMGLMGNKVFKKVTKIIFENKVLQESY